MNTKVGDLLFEKGKDKYKYVCIKVNARNTFPIVVYNISTNEFNCYKYSEIDLWFEIKKGE